MEKTNVMRLLDAANIPFNSYTYDGAGGALSGLEVATALGQDPEQVYKTLVTVGASGKNYVFVIPVGSELNLTFNGNVAHVFDKESGMNLEW